MRDSYESQADHRPWLARRPDWAAVPGQPQDHPARSTTPAVPPADAQAGPPSWAGPGQDSLHPLEPWSAARLSTGVQRAQGPHQGQFPDDGDSRGFGPGDWAARDQNHPGGQPMRGGPLERRPDDWLAYDPFRRHPAPPGPPPYPGRTVPFWRQGWADYDPYSGYPVWPGHPGYAGRNAGLRRLSKLTWRAAEVSAVVAVGFVALFAHTAHSAASHAGTQPGAKPSAHATATQHTKKRHKHHHHHHHAPALAPPAAPPAPPPPPAAPAAPAPPPAAPAAPAPPPPPPPPVTTSGGSGGGG